MTELRALVAEELAVAVDPRVSTLAELIANKHGSASRAVLFSGSTFIVALFGMFIDKFGTHWMVNYEYKQKQ